MSQTQERSAAAKTVGAQGYASLLVHAEPGITATHRVEVAARLSRALGARLIGMGAETFDAGLTMDPFFGYAAAEWVSLVQEQIGTDLKNAEAAFRRDAAGAEIEWRSVQDYPSRALARLARAADLIVMSPKTQSGATRSADPADVIMTSGRPVLIVPEGAHRLQATCVVVAWKDTREARRAVADALPFLKAAEDVILQAVCEESAVEETVFQADDVVSNLKRHGVNARANVIPMGAQSVREELERVANANKADLIVAGAYGHSRLAEWAMGGVTDDLIHKPDRFVLFSH